MPFCLALAQAQAPDPLSPPLRQWLSQHTPVRVAVEADYGPMVFAGANGKAEGLSIDLLQQVAQRIDMPWQALPPAPLHRLLKAAQSGQADLLTSLRPTPERAEFLLFTQPYVRVAAVLVQRQGTPALPGLQPLIGRPVAVGRGYAVEAVMRQRHPDVRWQAVDDDLQALQGVSTGRFDAAVVDEASLAFLVQRERLDDLVAGTHVGFNYELSFAVRKDWPQLRDILDQGIRAVDPQQREAVLARWLKAPAPSLVADKAPLATRLALGLLALALLAGALVAWRRWTTHRHG